MAPLRILVMCTANICRSPTAEHLLRRAAHDRDLTIEVSSAGFLFDGEPASERTVAAAGEHGLDLSGHRSRVVSAEMAADVDLVVTMERRHGRDLIVDLGVDPVRVHTLGALVTALADGGVGGAPMDRVAAVSEARPAGALLGEGPDEVADPHGRSRRRHRLMVETVASLSDGLLDGLFDEPARAEFGGPVG